MAAVSNFDFLIVGGGTAACVLANRLSEDPSARVLLIEAGAEASSMWIKMPIGISRLFTDPAVNWGYTTEPEARLENRGIYWPRGKVLGGCSSINGSAYVRGQAEDFDAWRQLGNAGWGWSDVLPYFRKLERREGSAEKSAGMLSVSFPRYVHPIARAYIEAGVRAGLPAKDDLSNPMGEGVSLMPYSVRKGVRDSSAEAYLRPARNRPNLTVGTSAFARRILLEGRRAVGVEFEQGGVIRQARAAREVILAAGAVNSPQLLMLSGIGPGRHLQEHGIAVLVDLPGVGENLHDHVYTTCSYRTAPWNSLNRQLRFPRVAWHGVSYYLAKRGPLTNGASQACAMVRGLPDSPCPDLQLVFRPMSHVYDRNMRISPDPVDRVTGGVAFLRPKSRGRLSLKSADPHQAPSLQANYLAEARDEQGMIAGMRWVRRIFQTEPLKSLILGEDAPGDSCRSDDDIRDYLRKTAGTFCHPSGTCKMGQDAMSVVDERLRVRGLEALRVVDASIMPALPSAGPAPAVFMIGEKAADLIKESRGRGADSQAIRVSSASAVSMRP